MDFQYGEAFTESSPEAYERLVLDVLIGDSTLFPRRRRGRGRLAGGRPAGAGVGRAPRRSPTGPASGVPRAADEMLARDGRTWRRA